MEVGTPTSMLLLRMDYLVAWVKSEPYHFLESSVKRPSLCIAVKSLSTSSHNVWVGRVDFLSNAAPNFS